MTSGLISFLTFLLGLLLGNWLAIGRDKRKEFNEAGAPIRGWLLKAKDKPSPFGRWPTDQEIDRFIHCLSPWRRSSFVKHLSDYRALHHSVQVTDAAGQVSYIVDAGVRRKLNELFRYTKPR